MGWAHEQLPPEPEPARGGGGGRRRRAGDGRHLRRRSRCAGWLVTGGGSRASNSERGVGEGLVLVESTREGGFRPDVLFIYQAPGGDHHQPGARGGRSMASEKDAALAAVPNDNPTIFDKIIKKEIPSTVVYEDEKVLAFRDINPQAPTHVVIIPKVKDGLTGLSKAEERHVEILGCLLYAAKVIAKQEGLEDGYRIVINDGPSGCQSVYHIHVHLLGGRQMNWPPG